MNGERAPRHGRVCGGGGGGQHVRMPARAPACDKYPLQLILTGVHFRPILGFLDYMWLAITCHVEALWIYKKFKATDN